MLPVSYIGILAGLFTLAGYIPYVIRIVKGEIKPERSSWLIWTLASFIVLISYYVIGARETIWVPLAYVIGSATITTLALSKHGQYGWGLLEKVSLVIAFVSSIRWIFWENVFLALLLNLGMSFVGYVKTIKTLFKDKNYQEDVPGWLLYFIGAALNIYALKTWTPEIASLPIMFFIMNGITLSFVLRNRRHEMAQKVIAK
jgi:hypothetical protein